MSETPRPSEEPAAKAATSDAPARRPPGRPKIGEGPRIPWAEVDALVVLGEAIPGAGPGERRYPSLRELAKRFGVSQTRIWIYTQKHKCFDRRKEMSLRAEARSDQLLVEKVASERAFATADLVRIVDQFLLGFEKELRDGHVKTDSAADFDRLARLRELLVGGVDSRTELTGTLTLEAIQQRHRHLRGQVASATPELTGTALPHTSGDDEGDAVTPRSERAAADAAAPVPSRGGQVASSTPELTGTALPHTSGDDDGDAATPQLEHAAADAAASVPCRAGRTAPTEADTVADSGATEAAGEPPRLQADVDPATAESAVAAEPRAREDDLPPWIADMDDLPPEPTEADDDLLPELANLGAELAGGEGA